MTVESPDSSVFVATDGGVVTVTMNRPEAMNAFNPAMLEALVAVFTAAAADVEARVIVLQGAGRAFSAGVDLKVLQEATFEAGRVGGVFDGPAGEAAAVVRRCALPVIAKVHGFCFTGALEMALQCDFIYTTVDTKFGDTHAKWGLRPTWGMSQTLAEAVGARRAKELSFTARTFTGADALAWGLAVEAAPTKEALDDLVAGRAAMIAENSKGAVAAYKDLYGVAREQKGIEAGLAEELRRDYPEITDTSARLSGFGKA